jgi:hypothetical protein
VAQFEGRVRRKQPRTQQVRQHRRNQDPAGRPGAEGLQPQAQERQDAQEQHRVVDQDDGQVHFEAAQAESDGGNHQGAQGHAAPGTGQFRTRQRLVLSGGQGKAYACQDREQRSGPARKNQAHPCWGEAGVRLESRKQVGGHHAQQRQPAGCVDTVQAGRNGPAGRRPGGSGGITGGHAQIVSHPAVPALSGKSPCIRIYVRIT